MQRVRIMPCLDLQHGRVVKGLQFVDIKDAGDPVECAVRYCQEGADELTLLDITATVEQRVAMAEVIRAVADVIDIPLTVGGGIRSVGDALAVIEAGADKVSVSSAALRNPQLVPELLQEITAESLVMAIDVDRNPELNSGYEVYIDGGRTATGRDVIEWARELESMGVKTMLPTSKTNDGMRTGYDLEIISKLRSSVSAEIIASGGAGAMEHFYAAVQAGANVLLAASLFHYGLIKIPELKAYLRSRGLGVTT